MTTNYFDNLPISTELQLALSALIAQADVESAGYSYSGTYVPDISDASDHALTFIFNDDETLYFTRIGGGSVPEAGDTIHVFGYIRVSNPELTDSISPSWQLSLPTGVGDVWFPEPALADVRAGQGGGDMWVAAIEPDADTLTMVIDGDLVAEGFQLRWIDLTYQVGAA